jgi:HEAT repeat protein
MEYAMKSLLVVLTGWAVLVSAACTNTKPQPAADVSPPAERTGPAALSAAGSGGADLPRDLTSDDESARLAAIDVLGRQGGNSAAAIPALIKQLDDSSPLVRAHAAHALGQIGPAAKPAAEALAKLCFDKEAAVRREAVKAYRHIRPGPDISIPLFTKLFGEAAPEMRIQVMAAMAEEGKAAVPALIEALGRDKSAYWACLVLADIGPDAQEAVPALEKVFQSRDEPEVRREAVLALAAIGPGAAAAVPALTQVLDEEDTLLHGPAVYALGAIGPKAKPAEEKIRKLADDKRSSPFLQTVCLWSLARVNPGDQQLVRAVVPRLVEALKAPEPRLRAIAARALIDLNPDPAIVRPVMQKVMQDASPEALNDMLDALASLGEKAVPRLIKALETEEVRAKAAAILGRIGPPAKAAVPALIKALSDKNPETRNEVLFALGAIGPDAKDAVPTISRALAAPDKNVCYSACYALGKIGPAAKPCCAELQKCLAGDDPFLAMASAWALAHIDPKDPQTAAKAVPVLMRALRDPDPLTRVQAAESLGLFGPLAGGAAAALSKLSGDQNAQVREAAANALKAIRP